MNAANSNVSYQRNLSTLHPVYERVDWYFSFYFGVLFWNIRQYHNELLMNLIIIPIVQMYDNYLWYLSNHPVMSMILSCEIWLIHHYPVHYVQYPMNHSIGEHVKFLPEQLIAMVWNVQWYPVCHLTLTDKNAHQYLAFYLILIDEKILFFLFASWSAWQIPMIQQAWDVWVQGYLK